MDPYSEGAPTPARPSMNVDGGLANAVQLGSEGALLPRIQHRPFVFRSRAPEQRGADHG